MPELMTASDLLGRQVNAFVPRLGYRTGRVIQVVNRMALVKFSDEWADWYHIRQLTLV